MFSTLNKINTIEGIEKAANLFLDRKQISGLSINAENYFENRLPR